MADLDIKALAMAVEKLTSEEIRKRLEELHEEEQGLKVMLRSACARERARRKVEE